MISPARARLFYEAMAIIGMILSLTGSVVFGIEGKWSLAVLLLVPMLFFAYSYLIKDVE